MQNFPGRQTAILVATDVAARGIDVSDVDAVINYDVPADTSTTLPDWYARAAPKKKEGVSHVLCARGEKPESAGASPPDPQYRASRKFQPAWIVVRKRKKKEQE